jgi:hypothetical protein
MTDLDKDEDQAMQAQMKEDFAPLAAWIKKAFGSIISDGAQPCHVGSSVAGCNWLCVSPQSSSRPA